MDSGPRAVSTRSPRLPRVAVALVASLGLLGGCFDSDEKYAPAAASTSTTGPITTTSSTSTSTSGSSSTTEAPDVTCRDAIDCVVGCAGQLQASMLPEPDLTCFLDCEEGLTVPEALHLFRLTECVTNVCIEAGECDVLVPTETSTGGSSSSSGGSSSGTDTGTSTGGPAVPPNPCLDCILAYMLDKNPGGMCQTLADECV